VRDSADGETITVIPLTFRKRGGRKLAVTPPARCGRGVDNVIVKARA
jgi:hypothetical protein